MHKLILISFVLLSIFGCAASYDVNVTGYGRLENNRDKSYDFDLASDIKTDLEAMKYIGMLEKQLSCIGWVKKEKSPNYTISPSFGITGAKTEPEPDARFGGGIGMFGGNMGSGVSLGTFIGTSTGSSNSKEYTKFLDIKLFNRGKTDQAPAWQGKIFSQDESKTLEDVMPVLIKFAVENFGKDTDGSKEFTFDATEENLKVLEECPVE
jgi:hypothetical protein